MDFRLTQKGFTDVPRSGHVCDTPVDEPIQLRPAIMGFSLFPVSGSETFSSLKSMDTSVNL